MELRQLRHFIVLAETLNFRRAAERLHISQPPLTVSIKKLEAEWRVALFDRNTHGVSLTAAGQAALGSARQALYFAEAAGRAAAAGAAGEVGTLRLGFVGSATYSLMPRLLSTFRQRHPGVTLLLEESFAADLLQRVRDETLDAALIRMVRHQRNPDGVNLTLLQTDHFVLAVPRYSPLAAQASVRLHDLHEEPFIGYSDAVSSYFRSVWAGLFHRAGFQPRVQQEATQVQTVLSLVESGLGLALVPSSASKYLSADLRILEIEDIREGPDMGVALATSARRDMHPVLASFARVSAEVSQDLEDGAPAIDLP